MLHPLVAFQARIPTTTRVERVAIVLVRKTSEFMSLLEQHLTIEELRQLASDPTAAQQRLLELVGSLRNKSEEHRAYTADVLQGIERLSASHTQLLAGLVLDPDCVVAAWSCRLLAKSEEQPQAMQALVACLTKQQQVSVQQEAARSLGRLGPLSNEAKLALETVAASGDARLQRLAKQALSESDHSHG